MGAPKKPGSIPVSKGVRWVKKANGWLYFECFNSSHSSDIMRFFHTREEAQAAFDESNKLPEVS